MDVLIHNLRTNPAIVVAVIVGVLVALNAVLAVVIAGGGLALAVQAAVGSLLVSVGGGAVVRARVEPVELAADRRALAVALATDAEYEESDRPDVPQD